MNNTYRALLFFWVSLILAFPTYASSDFGVLKGRIFDSQSKQGISGLQVVIQNPHSKFAVETDSFGSFILKLEPGQYFALVQGVNQKIAFYIFPQKTALLDIPVKASALPHPIHYTVQYHPFQQQTQAQQSSSQNTTSQNADQNTKPAAKPRERVIQPFIQTQHPENSNQNSPAKTIIPAPLHGKRYPMAGMVVPIKPEQAPSAPVIPAIAIMPFKDSTGNGLGLQTSRDIADYLFDLGKVKVIGPNSIIGAIGGVPADPLNGAFAQWIARKLGANDVVLGRIRKAQIQHHQYFFFVTADAVIKAVIQVMNVNTGSIITTFTRTASSGMFGLSGNKNRYYQRKTIRRLFKKASKNLARALGSQFLNIMQQQNQK